MYFTNIEGTDNYRDSMIEYVCQVFFLLTLVVFVGLGDASQTSTTFQILLLIKVSLITLIEYIILYRTNIDIINDNQIIFGYTISMRNMGLSSISQVLTFFLKQLCNTLFLSDKVRGFRVKVNKIWVDTQQQT